MSETATNDLATAAPAGDVDTPADTTTPQPPTQPEPLTPAPGPSLMLDGEAPRLGAAPAPPAPEQRPKPPLDQPPSAVPPEAGQSLPVVSPVLRSSEVADVPDATAAPAPTLPAPAPETPPSADEPGDADEREHPMAHLMPAKSAPSEASRRAAEIRAAKKAKAKKIKIGVAAGFLIVSAIVGPPLYKWLANAINEAGGLSTEEPAD